MIKFKYYFLTCFLVFTSTLTAGEYTIATFGDSTTAPRTVNGSPLYIYTDILRDELPAASITGEVFNHGSGGRHSGSVSDNDRFKKEHALDHYPDVIARNPDFVIMQFGINDSYVDSGTASVTDGVITGSTSRIPYDNTDPRNLNYDHNYKDNLTFIIEQFKTNGIRVVLMTSNHYGANKEQWRSDVLEVYVNRARQVAAQQNIELIDVWQMYVDYNAVDGQNYDDLLLDGVHPNALGHRLVADAIYAKLGIEMPFFQEQDIFFSGQGPVAQYRIPSMVVTNNGTILTACDARVERGGDAPNNIDLHLRRSTDLGQTWTDIQNIIDFPEQEAACDPSMIVDKTTGAIWCFYDYAIPTAGAYKGRTMYTHVIKSNDDGISWSAPIDLTNILKNPDWVSIQIGPGNGIQTRDGDLIIPCYSLLTSSQRTCNLIRSTDHGQSWTLSNPAPGAGSENQAIQRNDGSIMINIRRGGSRAITTTPDKGQTWTDRYNDAALIEPGCQGSLFRYSSTADGDDSDILLFANPASTSRSNMTVKISYDQGQTWPVSKVVYPGSSAYSSLTVLPDGTIGLLYERDSYSKITFARFNLAWLTSTEPEPEPLEAKHYKNFEYVYDFDDRSTTPDLLDIYPETGTKDFSLNLGNNGSTYPVMGQANVIDGLFTIDTGKTLLGSASGGRWYTAHSDGQTWNDSSINYEQGYTIECKVELVANEQLGSYSTQILASANGGTARSALSIAENSTIWNSSEIDANPNTQWQIFRIIQIPDRNLFKIYRGSTYANMEEIYQGIGSSSSLTPYFNIGDGSSSFGGKVIFDYIAFTPGAYKPIPCGDNVSIADINLDCYVNLFDFLILANNWLQCTDPASMQCLHTN